MEDVMIARYRGFLAIGLLIAAGVAVAVLLAGCGGSSAGPVSTTFTYDTYTNVMVGWDPSTENSNSIIALANVYDTLTKYNDETKEVEPLLATSWTTSPDALTWTFQLRPNVYFHTGRLMTAKAVKAAIERTIRLNQGAAYIWAAVKSIDTPSQDTVVFHLKYPGPLSIVASAGYGAYIFDTKASGSESLAKWFEAAHDAGTGPYTVQTWNSGQETELVLTSFPKYWGGWSGAHYKRIVFRVVKQDTTAAQLVGSGQVDFVQRISPALFASLKTNPQLQTLSVPQLMNLIAPLNCKSGPLADLTMRKAIAYAIDYKGIIAASKGAASPSIGIVPPGLWGHSDTLPTYSYDTAKAAQLLNSVGYGPGKKAMNLTLTYTQGDSSEQLVTSIMKSNLAKLNVNLRVQPLAWPTQWAKAQSTNLSDRQDIFMMYWWPDYADPYAWLGGLLATEKTPYWNLSYFSNPQFDEMAGRLEGVAATDMPQAIDLCRQMQIIAYEQMPVMVLYNVTGQFVALKSVGNLHVNPAYAYVVFVYDLEPLPS